MPGERREMEGDDRAGEGWRRREWGGGRKRGRRTGGGSWIASGTPGAEEGAGEGEWGLGCRGARGRVSGRDLEGSGAREVCRGWGDAGVERGVQKGIGAAGGCRGAGVGSGVQKAGLRGAEAGAECGARCPPLCTPVCGSLSTVSS